MADRIPRGTLARAVLALALSGLWIWAWVGWDWPVAFPAPTAAVVVPVAPPLPPTGLAPTIAGIDPAPFLEQPVFYPDRRARSFRGDATDEQAAPSTTLDFEVTTTVVTTKRTFAILRLRGGGNSVMARPDEVFEGDPAWHVTKIDRTSVTLINVQGVPLTLVVKTPAPASHASDPVKSVAEAGTGAPSKGQPAVQAPPATAVRPMQENGAIRAQIEARRRQANTTTQSHRTQ